MSSATAVRGPIPDFHAIVPAGGAGTRLWPLSRARRPKFLLDLDGSGLTLLQQTWERLIPLTGEQGLVVVTGQAHAEAVAQQLPGLPGENLFAEPSPRDSMAAIGLAAAVIGNRHPGAIVGSFAADHIITDRPAFHDAVNQAVAVARSGLLVTLGITPDHPSTAFGYICAGDPLDLIGAPDARSVWHFQEKPDAQTAAEYLRQGTYRWNAGMFIVQAKVLLDLLAKHRPELHAGIVELAASWDTSVRDAELERLWPTLEKIAFDYAIAEPAAAGGAVAVVPASIGWDDIGDFASVAKLAAAQAETDQPSRMSVLGETAQVLSRDASGVVVTSERLVAVLGLPDVVIVDTPDALLVTTRERAQDVKGLVDELKAQGRTDLV